MKVMRDTKWRYVGVFDGYLKFQDVRYADTFVLVKECKFVDVRHNRVHYMNIEDGQMRSRSHLDLNNSDATLCAKA